MAEPTISFRLIETLTFALYEDPIILFREYVQNSIDAYNEAIRDKSKEFDGFSVDITVSVLKLIKLYQNKRYTLEEALDKLSQVEAIVMSAAPEGDLEELVEILQLPKLALFASCRKYLSGGFDKDIKSLVKKGREQIEKDMELALETVSSIGAGVIDGAACCGKFLKDDLEQTTLFDEWLIECERMSEAMVSLKNFDESTGDED